MEKLLGPRPLGKLLGLPRNLKFLPASIFLIAPTLQKISSNFRVALNALQHSIHSSKSRFSILSNAMSGTQPVAVYAMKVPAGDVMVPAVPDFAAMFQLSMAAIDPSAEPEFEDGDKKRVARSTLKLIRVPGELFDDDSDDSDYSDIETDEDDVEESSGDEEVNGGPSDPSKAKKVNKLDLVKAIAEEDDDEDDDDEDDAEDEAAAKTALMKILKGKGKASESAEEDGDDDDDEDSLELEEVVVCTLDPDTVCFC